MIAIDPSLMRCGYFNIRAAGRGRPLAQGFLPGFARAPLHLDRAAAQAAAIGGGVCDAPRSTPPRIGIGGWFGQGHQSPRIIDNTSATARPSRSGSLL
jgi:hypothetical protein